MNREIKFRAVHTLTKHWFYEEHIVYHNDEWYEDWRAFEDGRELNLDQVAVMQHTGLKDKNGTEIYEGDLVSDLLNGSLGEVIFDEGCYLVDWEDELTTITLHQNIREFDVVVVGNIYENPELLERSQ